MSVVSCQKLAFREFGWGVGVSLCVSVNRPLQIYLSRAIVCSLNIKHFLFSNISNIFYRKLSLYYPDRIIKRQFSIKILGILLNNKWLLLIDGEFFLSMSCKHPGNFVPTNHTDRLKKLRMNCVTSYWWIFQTQCRYR